MVVLMVRMKEFWTVIERDLYLEMMMVVGKVML